MRGSAHHWQGFLAFSPPSRVVFKIYFALQKKRRRFDLDAFSGVQNEDDPSEQTVYSELSWRLGEIALSFKPKRQQIIAPEVGSKRAKIIAENWLKAENMTRELISLDQGLLLSLLQHLANSYFTKDPPVVRWDPELKILGQADTENRVIYLNPDQPAGYERFKPPLDHLERYYVTLLHEIAHFWYPERGLPSRLAWRMRRQIAEGKVPKELLDQAYLTADHENVELWAVKEFKRVRPWIRSSLRLPRLNLRARRCKYCYEKIPEGRPTDRVVTCENCQTILFVQVG